MKTNMLLIALMSISSILLGQVPQGIPYQAVARDAQGNPMSNQSLTVQFSLHEASADGQVVYQETQTSSTNAQGLFSLTFGAGVPSVGTFTSINWGSGYKFLQVQANFGNGYVELGTQQLMSVPYALYSGSAQNISANQNLSIGQDYQGGKIFYLDKTGMHGLIISDTTFTFNGPYLSVTGVIPNTSSSIYAGKTNTKYLSKIGNSTPDAFDFAENLVLNGYADWYIPSKDELLEAYFNLDISFFSQVSNFGMYSSSIFAVWSGCTQADKWQVASLNPNVEDAVLLVFMEYTSNNCTFPSPSFLTQVDFKVVRQF
jgi:hypothetical protein